MKSITSKLIFWVTLVVLVIMSGMGVRQYFQISQLIHAQVDHELELVHVRLAINLAPAMWSFDHASLLKNLGSEVASDHIAAIRVYDVDNDLIGEAGVARPRGQPIKTPIILNTTEGEYQLGHYQLFADLSELTELKAQILWETLFQVLFLCIALGIVISWLVKRLVSLPLGGLRDVMQEIAADETDLYHRIEIKNAHDEIGRVSFSFNQIISRIEELNLELSHQNEELNQSIIDLKRTQDQLIASEKLASLGSLVAGVAHEINTPVGVGITASTALSDDIEDFRSQAAKGTLTREGFNTRLEEIQETASLIFVNLDRVASLVKSFKQVAVDREVDEVRELDLTAFCDQILASVRPTYKHQSIRFINDIDPQVTLKTHPGQLAQVITNIVVNAANHGFEGGKAGEVRLSATPSDNDQQELIISDNGIGMDEETRSRLYEPFFTTRRNQGGTGLGMHIVYNLVTQNLDGSIECESAVGQGTQFKISLPKKPA